MLNAEKIYQQGSADSRAGTDWKAKDRCQHKQRPGVHTSSKKWAEQTSWYNIDYCLTFCFWWIVYTRCSSYDGDAKRTSPPEISKPARHNTANRVGYPNNWYQEGSIRRGQTRLDSHLERQSSCCIYGSNEIYLQQARGMEYYQEDGDQIFPFLWGVGAHCYLRCLLIFSSC